MIFLLHQCSQPHNKIYIEYILFIQDIFKNCLWCDCGQENWIPHHFIHWLLFIPRPWPLIICILPVIFAKKRAYLHFLFPSASLSKAKHYDNGIRKRRKKPGKLYYRCHFNRPTKEALPINVNGAGRIAPWLPKGTGWTAIFGRCTCR